MKKELYITDLILFATIFLTFLQGCDNVEVDTRPIAWRVYNNFNKEIVVYTVYDNEGEISPDEYVEPISLIARNSNHDAFYLKRTLYTLADEITREHPNTRMYFVIPSDDMDINNISYNISKSVAYLEINWDYLYSKIQVINGHALFAINFPEDCTVNPELGEIYNLDEFVELYGPLNAQGWDKVWQRWQQTHPKQEANMVQ